MIRTEEAFDKMLVAMEAFDLLTDERFSTLEARMVNGEALVNKMQEIFLTRSSDEWLQLLQIDSNLPVERVTEFADLPEDPHLRLNKIITPPVDDVGVDYIVNDPVNVVGVARVGAKKAPDIGEHTDEVLVELGYDADTIAALRERGIIQ